MNAFNQLNIYGKTKVQVAIERLKAFEPADGYYLAFSGGKDSVVIKHLADLAGVKYDAYYNLTSVDPPELVYFNRKYYSDVITNIPRYKDGKQITMWNLIVKKKYPPTRIMRYCCTYLKESSGIGRFVVTGVRRAESAKRANRAGLEVSTNKSDMRELLDPDNPTQESIHICQSKAQRILNPIIDWSDADVWDFIRSENIPYCELYDKGHKRLGCVGCPMANTKKQDLEIYPKYKQAYLKTFDRMLLERTKNAKNSTSWTTAEDVMEWWLNN